MATASSMILRSLRLTGEKSIGDTLTSAEQTAYLADLNAMLESWSIERLLCYTILQESFALTESDGTYTIGSSGNFNTARPNKIVSAFIRDSNGSDTPVAIIDVDAYNIITSKTADGSTPTQLYYDHGYVGGLGTIYLYPEPSASLTLHISSWKQLQSFAAIGDTVSLPPGYQRAIEFNFAIESAGGFRNVPVEVIKIANESKAAIKGVNAPDCHMQLDAGITTSSAYNILVG